MDEDDDLPPLDPVRVVLFIVVLAGAAFGGWRAWKARAAAPAHAVEKDYRKLFPTRGDEAPAPAMVTPDSRPAASSILLSVDESMKPPAPEPADKPAEPARPAQAKTAAAPAPKVFRGPKLNSGGGFSRLNGGAGIGAAARPTMGGGAPSSAPGAAPAAGQADAAAAGLPPDIQKMLSGAAEASKK